MQTLFVFWHDAAVCLHSETNGDDASSDFTRLESTEGR